MTIPTQVEAHYHILETREREKLAADLEGFSDFVLGVLVRRGGGTTRELAAAELERRQLAPTCPGCGARMNQTALGDWVCHAEHVEPRWFAAEEVRA